MVWKSRGCFEKVALVADVEGLVMNAVGFGVGLWGLS